jgi:hypothetical protein
MRLMHYFVLLILGAGMSGGASAKELDNSEAINAAADALLEALDPAQRERATFPFSAVERGRWSNLPIIAVEPSGLLIKDLNDAQRNAAQALLQASLSSQGYAKFTGVMRLEDSLRASAEARLAQTPESERTALLREMVATRNPALYAIAIFGDPGSSQWGWQWSGHHAAINFTVSEGRVAFTPTFLGSSPRVIQSGPYAGVAVLPKEGQRGLALLQSLTPEQQALARVSDKLPDGIFSGAGRKDSLSAFEGLSAKQLNADQQRLLRALVDEYVRNAEFDTADAQVGAIDAAGWDSLWFSWRGPVDADGRFYYRVHGPRLLIEYHRVDANHDHSIMRDPQNDYGADWLGKHISEHHPTAEQIRANMQQRFGEPEGS